MLERRDLLLAEGGTDRDRKVAGGIQHKASPLGAGLQAASSGRQPLGATEPKFTGPGCDVNSLTRAGTKTRAGQNCSTPPPLSNAVNQASNDCAINGVLSRAPWITAEVARTFEIFPGGGQRLWEP